jgi:hypothetical protein
LPDPCQRRQALGQRLGEVELAAQRDALGEMPEGRVELVPLVGHLGQAHMHCARSGQRRAAGWRGDLQRLLVGAGRGVQAALGPLHLAKEMAAPAGHGGFAGRSPLADAQGQRALGLREPATQPLGQAQVPIGVGCQHPLVFAKVGQCLRGERDRAVGVAAKHGQHAAFVRDGERPHQAPAPRQRLDPVPAKHALISAG